MNIREKGYSPGVDTDEGRNERVGVGEVGMEERV